MMTNIAIVDAYLLLNIWLGLGYLTTRAFLDFPLIKNALKEQWRLKFARFAFLLAAIMPFLMSYIIKWLPFRSNFNFQLKPFLHRASVAFTSNHDISPFYQSVTISPHWFIDLYDIAVIMIAISMLVVFYRYVKSILNMKKLIQNSYPYHIIHRISVIFSAEITVPCCWRFLYHNYVILPTHLLENKSDLKLALQHELQHLRQHDATWLQIFALCKLLGVFNPLLTAWVRWFEAQHEFACDEALILSKRIAPKNYGQCLLNVAQKALNSKSTHYFYVAAQPLTNLHSPSILKRRVTMLFHYQKRQTKRPVLWMISIGLALLASMTAYATNSNNTLSPLSISQVTALLKQSHSDNELNITVMLETVSEINQIRANPKAREFFHASIQRMSALAPTIRKQLQKNNLPNDLLALPLAESGYQPLPENSVHSAGIWQFIPSTARHYGLTVNVQQDERFNLSKSTQAALAYLQKLHTEFNDWNLAIMAYNQGEDEIHRLIAKTGEANAWKLIRSSSKNFELKRYLPSVHAAVIIMHHPELI